MLTRRSLLACAATVPSTAVASLRRVRLGGPVFLKSADPEEQAREHRRLGYSAAYCNPGLSIHDSVAIAATTKAFSAHDVLLAEVGAWVNMLDADEEKRRANMQLVAERLALADALGARCCVDIGGSYNPKLWDGPDPRNLTDEYFDATVVNCRRLIDEVKPTRTRFSIEIMGWALPNSADSYLRLIRAVDRRQFGAHVDVCNIVDSPQKFYANSTLIEEIFQKLGPWILSCHAKDVGPNATHLVETIPGRGGIDYKAYLLGIAGLKEETPLMLEHLSTAGQYDEGRAYIQKVAASCGVRFA